MKILKYYNNKFIRGNSNFFFKKLQNVSCLRFIIKKSKDRQKHRLKYTKEIRRDGTKCVASVRLKREPIYLYMSTKDMRNGVR